MADLNPLSASVIIILESEETGRMFCPPNCSICDDATDYVAFVDTVHDAARELTKKGWGEHNGRFFCPRCAKQIK